MSMKLSILYQSYPNKGTACVIGNLYVTIITGHWLTHSLYGLTLTGALTQNGPTPLAKYVALIKTRELSHNHFSYHFVHNK